MSGKQYIIDNSVLWSVLAYIKAMWTCNGCTSQAVWNDSEPSKWVFLPFAAKPPLFLARSLYTKVSERCFSAYSLYSTLAPTPLIWTNLIRPLWTQINEQDCFLTMLHFSMILESMWYSFASYLNCWIIHKHTFLSPCFIHEQFFNWFSRNYTYAVMEDCMYITHPSPWGGSVRCSRRRCSMDRQFSIALLTNTLSYSR